MQVAIENTGPLARSLTLTYGKDEVNARRQQVLRQLAGEVKTNGFRPGKTSLALIEKRYGEAATTKTEEDLLDEGFSQAVREQKLRPLGQIKQDSIDRSSGLKAVVSFEVKPTLTLPAAKDLTLDSQPVPVTDAEIDTAIAGIARRAGDMSALGDADTLIEDDSVVLSGTITAGGVEVRKLHDFHHLVGGYPLFGTEAKDVIVAFAGKTVGAQLTLETVLPKTFTPAEHAEKAATLSITIQSSQRLRAAAIDDALAVKVGATDLADLKAKLTARMADQRAQELRSKQAQELADKLVATVPIDLPPRLKDNAIANAAAEATARAASQGKDETDLAAVATQVEASLKRSLILDSLADQLDVKVSREDVEQQIRMAAYQTGRKPEDIAKQLQTSGQTMQVVQEIRESKALETLLDQVLAAKTGAASA